MTRRFYLASPKSVDVRRASMLIAHTKSRFTKSVVQISL